MTRIYKYFIKSLQNQKIKRDKQTILNSGYFDEAYYTSCNPDVAKSEYSAIDHYISFGAKEGRPASDKFDTSFYIKSYPDVLESGLNPLIHFIKTGLKEKRKAVSGEATPHFNKSFNENSLVVPFPYRIEQNKSPGTICVSCHIYYIDLVPEIYAGINQIPYRFHLFITTDTEDKKTYIQTYFSEKFTSNITIIIFPNRGRDIAPFLTARPQFFGQYDYVLHIHTKKSAYNPILEGWRGFLFKHLIGDTETIRSIFEIFQADEKVGIIAPVHYPPIRKTIGWGYNYILITQLAEKMGITLHENMEPDFPSGSMFWARTSALKPILQLHLNVEDFPAEAGQNDSTLAHAIERLFYISCEKAGFYWCKIQHSSITMTDTKHRSVLIKEDIKKAIQHTVKKLL